MKENQVTGKRTFRMSMNPVSPTICPPVVLGFNPQFAASPLYGVYEGLRLRVEYPLSQSAKSLLFSRRFDLAIDAQWKELGIELQQKVLFQLTEIHCWPAELRVEVRWPKPDELPYLPIPIPIFAPGLPMSESINELGIPSYMSFALMHEMTEFAISTRPEGTMLGDVRRYKFLKKSHYTRWFREGVASYAAIGVSRRLGVRPPFGAQAAEASLREIGPEILSWTQFDDTGDQTANFYSAAIGLVVRILEASPERSLAALMERLAQYDYVDGRRLSRAVKEVTGKTPAEIAQSPPAS